LTAAATKTPDHKVVTVLATYTQDGLNERLKD